MWEDVPGIFIFKFVCILIINKRYQGVALLFIAHFPLCSC
ncbi:hypothetical protein HMPREF9151_01295 [Hoylesella saccharolytica F0055]|uniref:Uncharacterized protein n=1 Tax=Hoylesella saccharolytica F0055 TaxID=1127699 RepID=L1NB04_9BACT|nr:hypothetical protein HMPREF9151_01295 [Hoylesella saccharolytica F0055]